MKKLLFVITQFYKGGAEVALLNLFRQLSPQKHEVDFLIIDQIILKDSQSLISQIPQWISVYNVSECEGKYAIIKKICNKVYCKLTRHQLFRKNAVDYVKNKLYDVAFSYGEWLSPEFVATKVKAKKKYVWIHSDIDKALYVDKKLLFGYDSAYDSYIFVSEHSRKVAEVAYPFLKNKSCIIHNMCDDKYVRKLSEELIDEKELRSDPWIVSVANLREEKNYPRMLETMRILRDSGINIKWLCIGSTANTFLFKKISALITKYNLNNDFILLGVKNNPYKYMSKCKAVIVLSDYESWSLVITEAKLLGVPVISTKTSGALEQIVNEMNGLLVSDEPPVIADTIIKLLNDEELQKTIRNNLVGFTTQKTVLFEFNNIIGD